MNRGSFRHLNYVANALGYRDAGGVTYAIKRIDAAPADLRRTIARIERRLAPRLFIVGRKGDGKDGKKDGKGSERFISVSFAGSLPGGGADGRGRSLSEEPVAVNSPGRSASRFLNVQLTALSARPLSAGHLTP